MIKGLKLIKLELREDHKGPVFNLDLTGLEIKEIPIIYRKKGVAGAPHYHEGWDASNDPQKVLIIKGKMKINLEDIDGNKETITIEEGDLLEVPKMVLHDYEILEDTIFGELRTGKYEEGKVDKKFLNDFRMMQR